MTMVIMEETVSKSQFKARALEYLRQIEQGKTLVITDHGRPVARVTPYRLDAEQALWQLRDTVLRYDDPTEPVGLSDWEALQ